MSVTELSGRRAGATDLAELLARLGVSKDSQIRVAGPDGLGALLWLCRRGYEHAAYVKRGAPCPGEPAQAVIAPHAISRDELERLLTETKLRPGGALVVQVEGVDREGALAALLGRFGYRIAARFDRGGRELIAARRIETASARAA
jgi:hypothetical protein